VRKPKGNGLLGPPSASSIPTPVHVAGVADDLELLAPEEVHAVAVSDERDTVGRDELADAGAVTPRVWAARWSTIQYGSSSRWSCHRYTSQASASTSARDSPRRTFFPADWRRPAATYTPTIHGWQPRIRAASAPETVDRPLRHRRILPRDPPGRSRLSTSDGLLARPGRAAECGMSLTEVLTDALTAFVRAD
jgi:hypothetical protein